MAGSSKLTFRLYVKKDEPVLRKMLSKEKIPVMFMQHANPALDTIVMEDNGKPIGFYCWNEQHGRAALVHFIVVKGKRSPTNARALIRHFIRIITTLGLRGIIVAIPNTNTKLFNFVKYYFKNVWAYKVQGPLMFVKAEV